MHDWGGMIGMAFAVRHPERIKRLVVLNTAAFGLPASKPLPVALKLGRDSGLGAFLIRGLNAFSAAAAWVGCKRQPMNAELRALYQAPYDTWENRIATLRFVQDIPLSPGDRAWELVQATSRGLETLQGVPMLIGWGLKDFVFDQHFLAEWEQRFPQAQVHRFPDAGHYVLEDVAGQLVPLIRDFIRGPVPAGAC
jgi:haloalkane dehalogenase